MKKTTLGAIASLAVAASLGSIAHASPISFGPTYLIVDGLRFSNFEVTTTDTSAVGTWTVSPVTPPPDAGIQITGAFNSGTGTETDYYITYEVTASSSIAIDDLYLSVGGVSLGDGGNISIAETAYPTLADLNGQSDAINVDNVYAPPTNCSACEMDVGLTGGPYETLYISKDVTLEGANGTAASLSSIDQLFSTVPEPATFALFGTGLLGFALLLGRRRLPNA